MHENTILLFLYLVGSSYSYSLTRFGSSSGCASDVYHIALEYVETCGRVGCRLTGVGSQEYYTIYSCNATEKSFNESLRQYGQRQNFTIGWYYDSTCKTLDAIEAKRVATCEGAENYECQSSRPHRMTCLYIQPDPPKSEPVAVPVSIPVPVNQPQSSSAPPSKLEPTAQSHPPSALVPQSILTPIVQPQSPSAQTPTAEIAGKGPVANSSTSDVEVIIYIALALVALALLFAGAKKVHDAKKAKNNPSNPEESQSLLSVAIEAEENDIRGRGSYSIVKEVVKDGKKYALKKILTDTSELYDEYKIMQQLDHRNILKVYEFNATTDAMPGLQSDFCDCSLADRIASLTDREILSYIKQLAIALHYIQFKIPGRKAVIHGDINPRNILLLKEHNVAKYKDVMLLKLADFGLAKMASKEKAPLPSFSPEDDEEAYKSRVMDIWTAPDIEYRNTYSFVTDLYSFAVVCAQIMFKDMSDNLEDLNDKLIETKTKSTTFHAQIASFCLDIIDYKYQKAISDPSAKIDKRKLVSKRPESAIEVKARLEEFKRMIALQEKLLASSDQENKEKPAVVEHN